MQIPNGPGPFPVVIGPGLILLVGRGEGQFAVPVLRRLRRLPDRDAVLHEVIRSHGYIVCSIAANDGDDDSVKMADASS